MAYNGSSNRYVEYSPEEGHLSAGLSNRFVSTSTGYHNLPRLREMLKAIIDGTNQNILLAEAQINKYALKVEPNSRLEKAQKQEWPAKLGDPKDVVSYKEYKAMRKLVTRSSDYIVKRYEKFMRGPSGNHNLDIVIANEVINQEAKNIVSFLDTYIGTVSNTSEYRTIEIFQDWAEDALTFTGQLRGITKKGAKGQHTESIPEAELGQINRQDAIQFQALFKTKVNAFNEEISQVIEDLTKDAGAFSKSYYDRFLGPTLKVDLDLINGLRSTGSKPTFLGLHARKGESSFGWQMEQLLTDGLKRNEKFRASMQGLIFTIDKRDDYNGFITQLEAKGAQVKQAFAITAPTKEEEEAFDELIKSIEDNPLSSVLDEEFVSDHNVLDNRLDPDAHPQYLLKEGGTIVGDIDVADGVKIDGVDINVHEHDGIDTPKIKGKNIEGGTLPVDAIDTDQRPAAPTGLRIKKVVEDVVPPGLSVFDITLAWDGEPNLTYEVQAVPYEF